MDGKRNQVAVYMTAAEKAHIEAAMVIDRVSSFSGFVASAALVRADLLIQKHHDLQKNKAST